MDIDSTSISAVSGCKRKRTAGRQKIPIERIQNKPSLQVTFTKRRKGLFKKAQEMAVQFGAHIKILVFSPAGKPYSFIHLPNSPTLGCHVAIPNRLSEDQKKFKQRKAGLMKKAEELSILCGIDLCAIVYDGPRDSKPEIFSSFSDVSSLITRFSNLSEKENIKGAKKQQKRIAAKNAEMARTEKENRELEMQMQIMLQGMLEGRLGLPQFGDNEVSNILNSVPVPCASNGSVDGWTVPTSVPLSVNPVGPLSEIVGLQNCAMDGSVKLLDLVGQSSYSVGSLSDVVGSSYADSQTNVSLNGSIGSDTCSEEWIDKWIDSIDIGSIESFLEECSCLESVGSDDQQELNVSDFVGPTEEFVGFDGLEDDEVIPMELLYDPSKVIEVSSSGSEMESCVDERDCFSVCDFNFDLC